MGAITLNRLAVSVDRQSTYGMTFVEKIEMLRKAKGLDQDELEPLAGLPATRISRWNGGTGEPTARQALRLARVLGCSLEYLADDSLDEDHPPELANQGEKNVLGMFRFLRDESGLSAEEAIAGMVAGVVLKQPKPPPPAERPRSRKRKA